MAVALRPTGQKAETFGVIWGTARTDVDRVTRTVELNDLIVSKANFPTLPDKGAQYLPGLRTALASALQTMALDSLEASLAASQTVKPAGHAVRNEPPNVIVVLRAGDCWCRSKASRSSRRFPIRASNA